MSGRLIVLCAAVAAGALYVAPAPLEAQAGGVIRRVQRGVPKKGAQRIVPGTRQQARRQNTNDFIQRLMQMEPQRRREFLKNNQRYQRLPKANRESIEQRLKQFDKMPAEQRELLVSRYQLFSRLRPEQQKQARGIYNQWSKMPRERRNRVSAAVRRLRQAQPEQRAQMMGSSRYMEMFDEGERGMIEQILELQPAGQQRDR